MTRAQAFITLLPLICAVAALSGFFADLLSAGQIFLFMGFVGVCIGELAARRAGRRAYDIGDRQTASATLDEDDLGIGA